VAKIFILKAIALKYRFKKTKVLRTSLLFFIVALFSYNLYGQNYDTRAKVKAIFIYNFTLYVEWPEAKKSGDFIIGVFGGYPVLIETLKNVAQKHKVGLQTLKIENYNSVAEIKNCHILFVIREKSNQLPGIINKLKDTNTLLVTDNKGLCKQGASISFFAEVNKQKFELNKSNIEKNNLKVSSKLLILAEVLY